MTVTVTKPQATLRELLAGLKKKTGLFGEQVLRAETATDFCNVVGHRKNLIINGGFDVWQRGTSFGGASGAAVAGYTADRWFAYFSLPGGTDYWTAVKPALTEYGNAIEITTATTGYGMIAQTIENTSRLTGWFTLSFYIKCSVPGNFARIEWRRNSGGGSPVSDPAYAQMSTQWTRVVKSFYIDETDNIRFLIGQNGNNPQATIQIAQVQFERGPAATPFEYRSPAEELALCQRYCQIIGGGYGEIPLIGTATSSTTGVAPYQFPVTMRAAPSVTIAGNWSWTNPSFTSALPWTSNTVYFATPRNVTISGTIASGLTIGNAIIGQTGSSATDIIKFEAEY
jgi:hypothetical protein